MIDQEAAVSTPPRSLAGVLHLCAYAMIAVTALRIIGSLAPAISNNYYEAAGVSIDFWQRVATNIAQANTLIPGLVGLVVLALLRRIGASKESPGFFVALAIAGLCGVILGLSSIYDLARLFTNTLDENLISVDGAAKVAVGVEWLAVALIATATVYLAWFLWSDTDTSADVGNGADDDEEADVVDDDRSAFADVPEGGESTSRDDVAVRESDNP